MRKILSLLLWTTIPNICHAGPIDLLLKRIAPGKEKHFQFVVERGNTQRSYFEITSYKERIRIKGNSYVSIASGLDWYLKNYCGVSYTDCDSILQLPDVLPRPQERTYRETHIQIGYTTYAPWQRLFWNWETWEKEIDRMALNGINACPVWTGTECIWKEFLTDYGLDEKDINQYLFGTEKVPKDWLKGQEKLHKKILQRMQNLGMLPIYPAFTGTVPKSLTDQKKNLITIADHTADNLLKQETTVSADDPLFAQMAKKWYQNCERIYGTVPFYQGSISGQDFPSDIQKAILKQNPEANWIIPTDRYILQSINTNGMDQQKSLLAYTEEATTNNWKNISATKMIPWIWIWNGNNSNSGALKLHVAINQPEQASNNPETASLILGVGSNIGSSQTNPLSYSLIHGRRWTPEVISLSDEIKELLHLRYGCSDSLVQEACLRLTELEYGYDAYNSFLCQRPAMNLLEAETPDTALCQQITGILTDFLRIKEKAETNSNYRKDLIRLSAMLLEEKGRLLYKQICQDFQNRDTQKLIQNQKKFLQLIHLADSVRACENTLRWSYWMTQADKNQKGKECGGVLWYKSLIRKQEQATGMVPALSGILSEYCAPCWELFFDWMNRKIRSGQIAAPQYQGLDDIWYKQAENEPKTESVPYDIYQIIIDSMNL